MKITSAGLMFAVVGILALALCTWSFAQGTQSPSSSQRKGTAAGKVAANSALQPQFRTGYEVGEATGQPLDAHTWMVFQNTSALPGATAWPMSVFYESPGDVSDRYAKIIDDPTQVGNKVLHFWLQNAVIPAGFQNHTKGRVQTGFSGNLVDAKEVYASQRVFLHPDMDHLATYPATSDPWWIGVLIQELWTGASWQGHTHPSRISLTLYPLAGKLHFSLLAHSGIDSSRTYWHESRSDYDVPTGEWITIETGYKMGDDTTGRMVIVVTREATGEREVLFDVTGWTYDPLADQPGGPGPVSLSHWNAQKAYASDNVVNHIRGQGGALQMYWDDFSFSNAWPPAWPQ